ncbi:hypothetical protein [Caudovirales GX15bay]|nr:hypothetical protein [Caudovirales GX15bay]
MVQQSTSRRRAVVGWLEDDVFTEWRRLYRSYQRPGRTKYVKRLANRRERREVRTEIQVELLLDPNEPELGLEDR